MLKKLLRDNEFVNPLVRSILKFSQKFIKPLSWLTSYYRVYGIVGLNICDTYFKIYTVSDDHIANEIFYNHGYEMDEFVLVKELTKRSNYFIDVGANTGIFSIYVALANPKMKTLSFEPYPSNYDRLLKNIKLNGLSNIETFPRALGKQETRIQFTIPADGGLATTASANAEFTTHFHKMAYREIDVKQTTLDIQLQSYTITSFDLIKIDVEYYELNVLKGAIETLSQKRPLLLIEILSFEKLVAQFPEMEGRIDRNHASQIQEFLFGLGYFPYALTSEGICFIDSVLNDQHNRNFLFIPKKLKSDFLPYTDIFAAFEEF